MQMRRTFPMPEHMDIPLVFYDDVQLMLVEDEVLNNSFEDPRGKLLCRTSCCTVINNLILDAAKSKDHILVGADESLLLLIYDTIMANHLHCIPVSSSFSYSGRKSKNSPRMLFIDKHTLGQDFY